MSHPKMPEVEVQKLYPAGSVVPRAVSHGASPADAVRAPGPSPWQNLILAGYVPDAEDMSLIVRAWTKATRLHLLTHSEDGCPDDWDCEQDADLYDWIPKFIRWENCRYAEILRG